MKKVKIILDSTGDIPIEWLEKYDVEIVSLFVNWPDGTSEPDVRDPKEIEDFYRRIKEAKELPRTSQPTVEDFKKLYLKAKEENYDEIIVLCISSNLSGTINSANMAAKEVDLPVYVVDTRLASAANALVARRVREILNEGADGEEAYKKILEELNAGRFRAVFYVSDFNFLVKGGRVTKIQGFLGTMLKIRVCVHINEEGKLIPYKKVRGNQKAAEALVEKVKEYIPEGSKLRILPVHADNESGAKDVERIFREYYDVETVGLAMMGKVITTHVGPGTAGAGVEVIT